MAQAEPEGERFVGRSRNAVMTQLWIALCANLLILFVKFANRLAWSIGGTLRLLQLNLFDRRPLLDLFRTLSDPPSVPRQTELQFA